MISKTVLLFSTKVPAEVISVLEELCDKREDQFVHIESVTSHAVHLVSFEKANHIAINAIVGEMINRCKLNTGPGMAYDERQNCTYMKLYSRIGSDLAGHMANKVKDLF